MIMKRFNDLLDFIGANKQVETIKLLVINLVIIAGTGAAVYFLKNLMYIFVGLIGLAVADYLLISSYTNRKKEIIKERDNELITVIGYFEFFISNSYNVYQAFQALIPYSSSWMEEQIQYLLNEIDNDKSVKPFISFANRFVNKVAGNVMLSIYQMVEEGENSMHMLQFDALFQQLSKNHNQELIDDKERSMGSISSLPLIGAGAITVLLTFGIISVMGEMISVL